MKPRENTLAALTALVAMGTLLSACGGGYSETAPPPAAPAPPAVAGHELPATALSSVEGLVQWARAQAVSEERDPLRVQGAVLPFSDTDEPLPISGSL